MIREECEGHVSGVRKTSQEVCKAITQKQRTDEERIDSEADRLPCIFEITLESVETPH